jgi:hypothetical protein
METLELNQISGRRKLNQLLLFYLKEEEHKSTELLILFTVIQKIFKVSHMLKP